MSQWSEQYEAAHQEWLVKQMEKQWSEDAICWLNDVAYRLRPGRDTAWYAYGAHHIYVWAAVMDYGYTAPPHVSNELWLRFQAGIEADAQIYEGP